MINPFASDTYRVGYVPSVPLFSRRIISRISVTEPLYLGFTRAAEALFITPSGLSVLIRELETQLGFRLFDRTTRQVALTPSGADFLPVAQRSLAEVDAATSRFGRSASQASQTLSIGAAPWSPRTS
jgi:DNA-binding transcriptional LysR family regulator